MVDSVFLLALVALVAAMTSWRDTLEGLIEAIDRFRGGGPPTPMHPLPANDSRLLRSRFRKPPIPL